MIAGDNSLALAMGPSVARTEEQSKQSEKSARPRLQALALMYTWTIRGDPDNVAVDGSLTLDTHRLRVMLWRTAPATQSERTLQISNADSDTRDRHSFTATHLRWLWLAGTGRWESLLSAPKDGANDMVGALIPSFVHRSYGIVFCFSELKTSALPMDL